MAEITATEAARRFSELLDAIEHRRKSFVITRGGKPVASIAPAPTTTGKAVKGLLRAEPTDPEWVRDLSRLRDSMTIEERTWRA